MGLMGGVSAQRIDETTFEVSAKGNGFTDQETISHYVMRKAAEETVADGYDLFMIVDSRDRSHFSTFTTAGTVNTTTTGQASIYGNQISGTATTNGYYTPPATHHIFKPGQAATVKMFKGAKPANAPPNVYDAREVLRFMTPVKK
jgi:hypothetical protein